MKKLLSVILVLALSMGMIVIAAEESAEVVMSISAAGELVLTAEAVEVTDTDNDGALTIADALTCAHDRYYTGEGKGFTTVTTQWGLGIETLWGIANGGSYGYYVNDASAFSLADPIKDGDYVYAFTYADLTGWSDSYTWFDSIEKSAEVGKATEFTVSNYVYDENWNRIEAHPSGASVYVDGADTGIKTDANGAFSLTFEKTGKYTVTLRSETAVLTPPVCIVDVKLPETNVLVSISAAGELVLAVKPVEVTDADGDGVLSISDALACAHEEYYTAEGVGYSTVTTEWGLGLETLWGIANGGSYGYYINNQSPLNLGDTVKNGDYIYAYAYADLTGWSDSFTWFDSFEKEAAAGEAVKFTTSNSSYDENWNPLTLHPAGASVYVDGADTGIKTDENGCFTLTFDKAGEYTVSLRSDSAVLTPPVCKVTVRSFADIVGHWGADEIEKAVAAGLFAGTNRGFEPGLQMNRAMLVTVLWRYEGKPEASGDNVFSDVPTGEWYSEAVKWAAENEIVMGYGDSFRPMAPISRQELILILYRYAGFKGMDVSASASLNSFTDAASTASWAQEAMAWAVAEKLISGSAGKLDPTGPAVRAQSAAILIRFIEK